MNSSSSEASERESLIGAIATLDLPNAKLSRSYYYAHLPLALIDAIFSIGVRYTQVLNVVGHYARRMNWEVYRAHGEPFPARDQQHTVAEFLASFHSTQNPGELFGNYGYANPRSSTPIRKAQLAKEVAEILDSHKIQVFQDLESFPRPEALDEELKLLPAMSSGIVVRYLRMLAGDDQQVKPDRWIVRFIGEALHRRVSPDEAVSLLRSVANHFRDKGLAGISARLIDHLVWSSAKSSGRRHKSIDPAVFARMPDYDISFDDFWDSCRAGGVVDNLRYGLDNDEERLWIKSSGSHCHLKDDNCYRIWRSTVRRYLSQAKDKAFRANHGWFTKVYDHITGAVGSAHSEMRGAR